MPRLNILTDKEQIEFDFPPTLTVKARAVCFAIDESANAPAICYFPVFSWRCCMLITTLEPRTKADDQNNQAVKLLENEFKKPSGQQNYGESIALLNQAMLSGQRDAIYNLAYVKEEHERSPGGVHEVIALYRMASTLGHAPAMTALGLLGCHLNRAYPHLNLITLSETKTLFERASRLQYTPAKVQLACMYKDNPKLFSISVDSAIRKAISLLDTVIEQEADVYAMHIRADMYKDGQGTSDGKPDYVMAAALYKRAIETSYNKGRYHENRWSQICLDSLERSTAQTIALTAIGAVILVAVSPILIPIMAMDSNRSSNRSRLFYTSRSVTASSDNAQQRISHFKPKMD